MTADLLGLIFLPLVVIGVSYVEDVCELKSEIQVINCDGRHLTLLQFRLKHSGYSILSLKDTNITSLQFDLVYIPDLQTIDARRTSLKCQNVAQHIIQSLDRIIVNGKACSVSDAQSKFQKSEAETKNMSKTLTTSYHKTTTKQNHEDDVEINVKKISYLKDLLKNANRLVGISVSTQVRVKYEGRQKMKKKLWKNSVSASKKKHSDVMFYGIIAGFGSLSTVSFILSIVAFCMVRRNRKGKHLEFIPIDSIPPRPRNSTGTVIL